VIQGPPQIKADSDNPNGRGAVRRIGLGGVPEALFGILEESGGPKGWEISVAAGGRTSVRLNSRSGGAELDLFHRAKIDRLACMP